MTEEIDYKQLFIELAREVYKFEGYYDDIHEVIIKAKLSCKNCADPPLDGTNFYWIDGFCSDHCKSDYTSRNKMTELQECVFCLEQVERLPHLCQFESDARLATLHSLAESVITKGRECHAAVEKHGHYEASDWDGLTDLIEKMNIGLGSAMAAERMVRSRLEKAACAELVKEKLEHSELFNKYPAAIESPEFGPAFIEYAKYHFQMDRPAYAKELPPHFQKLGELLKALESQN